MIREGIDDRNRFKRMPKIPKICILQTAKGTVKVRFSGIFVLKNSKLRVFFAVDSYSENTSNRSTTSKVIIRQSFSVWTFWTEPLEAQETNVLLITERLFPECLFV